MENQHRKINGYRDLDQADIEMMNKIKAHGEETKKLMDEVAAFERDKAGQLHDAAHQSFDESKDLTAFQTNIAGLNNEVAETNRWFSTAANHLQQGYMALVRVVAKPKGF